MCIQEKSGSCVGCNVLDIVLNDVNNYGTSVESAVQTAQEQYCPDGNSLQVSRIRQKRGYSFGSVGSSMVEIR